MDRTAVLKVGVAASASVCALFGGVVLAQYIVAKKKRAGKKTRIIEMVSTHRKLEKRRSSRATSLCACVKTARGCNERTRSFAFKIKAVRGITFGHSRSWQFYISNCDYLTHLDTYKVFEHLTQQYKH